MHCLTAQECAALLKSNAVNGVDENGEPALVGEHSIRCPAPQRAREIERLSADLTHWVGRFERALLWLTDWPFYTPQEMAIVKALRGGLKETRPLIHTPGHLFEWEELDELGGWVALMMCWGWDAHLFTVPFTERMFQTSHEDFVWITASRSRDLNLLKSSLVRLDLKCDEI